MSDMRVQQSRLRSEYRYACNNPYHAGAPLWTFVSEMFSLDAKQSRETCRAIGWNPEMPIGELLPAAEQTA